MRRRTRRQLVGLLAAGFLVGVLPAAPAVAAHEPGDLQIVLSIDCDNHDAATGAHEPIITWWSGGYGTFEFEVYFTVEYPVGTVIGAIVPFGLTSEGRHDSWLSGVPVPNGEYKVNVYADDTLYLTATEDCTVPVVNPTPYAPEDVHTERPAAPTERALVHFGWQPRPI